VGSGPLSHRADSVFFIVAKDSTESLEFKRTRLRREITAAAAKPCQSEGKRE
jgi:hypothetical protein